MFVTTNMVVKDNSDEKELPNFFYAGKYESSPFHVEPAKDTVYKIGSSVPLTVKATKAKAQKNNWLYYYSSSISQKAN